MCYSECSTIEYNSVDKVFMVSTRKKRQSNRWIFSHVDDFDQDITLGNASSGSQENSVVKEGTIDRVFTAGTSSKNGECESMSLMKVRRK